MRKTIFLVIIFIFILNALTFAEINIYKYGKEKISVQSSYISKYAKYKDKNIGVDFSLSKNLEMNGKNSIYLTIEKTINIGTTIIDEDFNNILLTMKHPPKFEIYKDNSLKTILLKKATKIDLKTIQFELSENVYTLFSEAEKIIVILPMQDSSEIRIELPEKIVQEWKYVINRNYKKQPKEELIYKK